MIKLVDFFRPLYLTHTHILCHWMLYYIHDMAQHLVSKVERTSYTVISLFQISKARVHYYHCILYLPTQHAYACEIAWFISHMYKYCSNIFPLIILYCRAKTKLTIGERSFSTTQSIQNKQYIQMHNTTHTFTTQTHTQTNTCIFNTISGIQLIKCVA